MARSTKQQIEDAEKRAQALELRKAGATYAQIATALKYTDASAARKVVKRALELTVQEPADELRKLEVERLDAMLRALWPAAISGKWLAVDRCLAIMDRRSRLLGLDAPQRSEVKVITEDLIDAEIRKLTAQLAEHDPVTAD